jgi:hypothetical protein
MPGTLRARQKSNPCFRRKPPSPAGRKPLPLGVGGLSTLYALGPFLSGGGVPPLDYQEMSVKYWNLLRALGVL